MARVQSVGKLHFTCNPYVPQRGQSIIHVDAIEIPETLDLCNEQEYSCNQMAHLGRIGLCGIIYIL